MLVSSNIIKGKLYTSNPEGLKNIKSNAELWQITRAGNMIPNTILVRNLAPSQQLFHTFVTKWRHLQPEAWWPLYEKQFVDEMKTEEKIISLRAIYRKLLEGKNIVLICFCKDHNFCHRKLVGEFFMQYGVEAVELNPLQTKVVINDPIEQLSFFME